MTTNQRTQPASCSTDHWLRAFAQAACFWPPFVPMASGWRTNTKQARR